VTIKDNGTFKGTLDVTVDGPNDLSQCPLTAACFSITHTWVGDLSISLTSPDGQTYLLMADANNNFGGCGTPQANANVCIVPGTGKPLANKTDYVCNTAPCPSGDCCLNGNWTVPCGGVTDPVSGAVQAPNCTLDDFNKAGSPANGTWTLTVNDICAQHVGSLDNFSLTFACGTVECIVCKADAGTLNSPDVKACFGYPSLKLNLVPEYKNNSPPPVGQYAYAYVISRNGVIVDIQSTSDMSTYLPGNYQVCGISYLATAAGKLTSLVSLDVETAKALLDSPTAPFCADMTDDCVAVLIGPPVWPTTIDTTVCIGECVTIGGKDFCESGSITLSSWLGCDSIVNVILKNVAPIFTTVTDTVCQGECIVINNQLFCPPGPHLMLLENWQGCDSIITLKLHETVTTAVIEPPNPPPLSCNNPSVVLSGSTSLPANVSYSWTGPAGFVSEQPVITVSAPGIYTLTVANPAVSPSCTSVASVLVTSNVKIPDIQVNTPVHAICTGEAFDVSSINLVDLNKTVPVVTYHSGLPPTAANQLTGLIVSPEATTTYYVLATSNDCTDIDSVTIAVHPVPTADFTVVLPECTDAPITVTYTGTAGPDAIFNWDFENGDAVPGGGQGPHSVEWVVAGTKTISLEVSENECTSQPFSQSVTVYAPVKVVMEAVAAVCLGSNTTPIQLVATQMGGVGNGNFTFEGPGISSQSGIFNPAEAGPGMHTVLVTYQEGVCSYNASGIIRVVPYPIPTFTVTSPVCQSEASMVNFTGIASNQAVFHWNFSDGLATSGMGAGPQTVMWPNAGNHEISLIIDEEGCTSSAYSQSVQVDTELETPLIECISTTSDVQFNWNTVAHHQEIIVSGGLNGTPLSDTSYLVSGLMPGTPVTLQLTITGNTACPAVTTEKTCSADTCPAVFVEVKPVAVVCLSPLVENIKLEASVTGGNTGGESAWSGPGIIDSVGGIFSPLVAGVGKHPIIFRHLENNCSYSDSIEIQVNTQPVADAGQDITRSCQDEPGEVVLGGENTTTGPGIVYDWDAGSGAFPGDSTVLHPSISQSGNYILHVRASLPGCQASDTVVVSITQDVPVPQVNISAVSCYGKEDGAISVVSVAGGTPPYLFSYNGSAFSHSGSFENLPAGVYDIKVLDAAGCEGVFFADIQQPPELLVELLVDAESGNTIRLGDSVQLAALITLPDSSLDEIRWEPADLLTCTDCLKPVAYPLETTTFVVTAGSNGCLDSDAAIIFVKKDRSVFVPSAFSPNNDGMNDEFRIYAGLQVARIRFFRVYSRWGEVVYEAHHIQPNDPAIGWDGTQGEKELNPGVFTWIAEVEWIDGEKEVFTGDVILMR
jgi:gliding motility-associated-like protein